MYKNTPLIGIVILTTILISVYALLSAVFFNNGNEAEQEETNESENNSNSDSMDDFLWGVDSANYTDESLYSCVVDHFGQPKIWGRYLGDKDGVSYGMDTSEVNYLHENDIQILVIYNHVNDARGFENGIDHAEQGIALADELDIPDNVALFVDIEPDYPIDSAFMEGWYEVLSASSYAPAVYGVFNEDSELFEAYNAMEEEVQENMIVWTAYPQEEITSKENAPEFNAQGPERAQIYGWQYAIDAETCNIDTNLFHEDILEYLW